MMNNENGRSMVEMLGVLAIIGVLSVAGIAGYTMAMNKYRANEIMNTASQVVILARALQAGKGGIGYATNSSDTTTNATDIGITLPNGATKIEADCSSGTTCNVTIKVNATLKDLVEAGFVSGNGIGNVLVTS